MKRKTTEEFVFDAKMVHEDRYDYSLTKYVNAHTKVKIICSKHGIFEQTPNHHLNNEGCSKCAGKNKTTEEFINEANLIHNNKYDYSVVKYNEAKDKVRIICFEHGEFLQKPINHLYGQGCPKCGGSFKSSTADFVEKAKTIHDNKYNYSLIEYVGNKIMVKIICPLHGIFEQKPNNHLCGQGCSKCDGKNKTTEEFISESKLIHNNKYDYSLVDYKNSKLKIKNICSKHGVFKQTPNSHLSGQGCPKCENKNKTTEEFVGEAKKLHGDKYDYSLVNYIQCKFKVKIICSKHGIFEQTPSDHLSGYGCKSCNESKGELRIKKYLDENKIKYVREKTFNDCRNKLPLHFDFHLPNKNILIEYDGLQHLKPIKHFGGEIGFKLRQINDEIKNNFAKNNNIYLLRIKDCEINNVEQILKNIL